MSGNRPRSLDGKGLICTRAVKRITAFPKAAVMGLFKADLYRSFAVGFALGAAALLATAGSWADTPKSGVIPAAEAAPIAIDQTR